MIVKLIDLGSSPYLWGASLADRCLLSIWKDLQGLSRPGPSAVHVVLDFDQVEAANVSFIKGIFLWLFQHGRAYARRTPSPPLPQSSIPPPAFNCVPFIANANPEVLAEVDEVMTRHHFPYLLATKWSPQEVTSARISGYLDEVLLRTLLYVADAGETTAAKLHKAYSDERISPTAWSNRLADLFELRFLSRVKSGRSLLYRTVVKEISHG